VCAVLPVLSSTFSTSMSIVVLYLFFLSLKKKQVGDRIEYADGGGITNDVEFRTGIITNIYDDDGWQRKVPVPLHPELIFPRENSILPRYIQLPICLERIAFFVLCLLLLLLLLLLVFLTDC